MGPQTRSHPHSILDCVQQERLDMKKWASLSLCAAALFGTLTPASAQAVTWHSSWPLALSAAKRSGRLIVATLYTSGTPEASKFVQQTLRAPQVVAALREEFECVRLDPTKRLPWPEAAKSEDVKGATAAVICDPDGTPFYLTFGPLKPERFLYYLGQAKRYRQMEQEAAELERRYRGNPQSPEQRFQLGRWYMLKGGADICSIMAAAFGGAEGLVEALAGEMPQTLSFGPMDPTDAPTAQPPTDTATTGGQGAGEGETPQIAMGLWMGMETDEGKAKQLRAKGAALLDVFRKQDPNNRLGHAGEIDLLLMQNAMIDKREQEAEALARRYVAQNPQGEGVSLAYVVQAMAALSRLEDQEGPPDFSEAKELLDRAMNAPGDDGSRVLAGLFRMMLEFMDVLMQGFIEAFQEMGKQMEQGMKQR